MSQSPKEDQENNSVVSEEKAQMSREAAIRTLWRKSILHWKLDKNQMDMYNLATKSDHTIVVIGSARQLGKSFFLCTLAVETCLKKKNCIVKYVAPKVKDVRRIIAPLIREIVGDAPEDLLPKYKTHEHVFRFSNGSEIQLAGTDNGHAESIRGNKADLCIIDEAGFCDDLQYIVNSILLPTTTTTNGKIVMASTPPKSADHDFMQFMREAEQAGAFIRKTIYDNPRLKAKEIQRLADAVGGVDSVDFKREYLVKMMTDINDAVIPEFTDELKALVVKEHPRPPYYDTYVGMDIGGSDLTAVIFGYYDFRLATLVIEDELVINGRAMVTDTLAKEIKRKEEMWFTHPTGGYKPPLLRIADNNNPILLNDLVSKHGISFLPTLKDNKEAALNNLRLLLKSGKVIINPRCVTLISHLQNATWNKRRDSYTRSADKGHYDALDALVYLCRNINTTKNPYPPGYDVNFGQDYHIAEKPKATQLDRQIKEMFIIKPRRNSRRF